MSRFHVAASGRTVPCTAGKRACPRGGEEAHYDSVQEAAQASAEAAIEEIETRLSVLDVQLTNARNNREFHEARVRFLEEGGTVSEFEERIVAANAAPEELRPFFFSKPAHRVPEGKLLNSSRAVEVLARREHPKGSESLHQALLARRGHPDRPDGKPPLTDGLETMAASGFVNDHFWRVSDEREMLRVHLPETLEKLERQLPRTK